MHGCICIYIQMRTYQSGQRHSHSIGVHIPHRAAAAAVLHTSIHIYTYICICIPPKNLRCGGFSTPYTHLCLICTIKSELLYIPICTTNEWAGVDIRWFPVDGFDSRCISRSFLCDIPTYQSGQRYGGAIGANISHRTAAAGISGTSIYVHTKICIYKIPTYMCIYMYTYISARTRIRWDDWCEFLALHDRRGRSARINIYVHIYLYVYTYPYISIRATMR